MNKDEWDGSVGDKGGRNEGSTKSEGDNGFFKMKEKTNVNEGEEWKYREEERKERREEAS